MVMVYALVGFGVLVLVGFAYISWRQAARLKYFCDSCEQYLGQGRSRYTVCPKCGDNRYYTRKEGVP